MIGRLPDVIVACVGGGSNAAGIFHPFITKTSVRLVGVEAGGRSSDPGHHAAPLSFGRPGVLHGSLSYVLQDEFGQTADVHSCSAGLDYPGVGPEHAHWKETGRVEYTTATDADALQAFATLAASIDHNAKGKALLKALDIAFGKAGQLGAAQKAIIFTESRRTQSYLLRVLADSPFARGIVLFNGSNTDDRSKQIYAEWLQRHIGTDRVTGSRTADMRYVGQGHEITVALPVRPLTEADAAALRETFEKEYTALFARPIPGAAIEALSWSVLVATEARLPEPAAPVKNGAAATAQGRRAFFDGRAGGTVEVPLYRREKLAPGAVLAGPAVIAEDETSTFVSAGFTAHVDAAGCIVMERKPA